MILLLIFCDSERSAYVFRHEPDYKGRERFLLQGIISDVMINIRKLREICLC